MPNINDEIDKKIEEFFFGPGKSPDEYKKLFFINNPTNKKPKFSPLYLARRDIYYCFGMNPQDPKHTSERFSDKIEFGPAYFAGIWLIWETLITLARSTGERDQNNFIRKLLKINSINVLALRQLRHAITHMNYGLRHRDRQYGLYQFALSSNFKHLIRKGRKSKYPSKNYRVNPVIFHQRFEKGLTNLRDQLSRQHNRQLRFKFNHSYPTKRSNWVGMY